MQCEACIGEAQGLPQTTQNQMGPLIMYEMTKVFKRAKFDLFGNLNRPKVFGRVAIAMVAMFLFGCSKTENQHAVLDTLTRCEQSYELSLSYVQRETPMGDFHNVKSTDVKIKLKIFGPEKVDSVWNQDYPDVACTVSTGSVGIRDRSFSICTALPSARFWVNEQGVVSLVALSNGQAMIVSQEENNWVQIPDKPDGLYEFVLSSYDPRDWFWSYQACLFLREENGNTEDWLPSSVEDLRDAFREFKND